MSGVEIQYIAVLVRTLICDIPTLLNACIYTFNLIGPCNKRLNIQSHKDTYALTTDIWAISSIAQRVNLRSFTLLWHYFNPLTLSNVNVSPWKWSFSDHAQLQKMGKNCRRLFSQVLYGILHHKVSHSRCGRKVTAKKCTKTFDAPRAEWLL